MGQKQAKLRQEVVEELAYQTGFPEAEVQEWYKGFLKDCPTGHLSIEEFRRIYAKFFPYGDVTRFAEYVFRAFDRNRDGIIDFQEFLLTLSVTSRGDIEQKLRWAFSMYDVDGDGFISRQDLCDVIASVYSMIGSTIRLPEDESTPERRSDKIFRKMDVNHDDRISFEEFRGGIQSDKLLLRLLDASVSGTESCGGGSNIQDPKYIPLDMNGHGDHNGPTGRFTKQKSDASLSEYGLKQSSQGTSDQQQQQQQQQQ